MTQPATPALRPAGIGAVLAHRDFRLLWIGEGVSLIGNQFYLIAVPWLLLQISGGSGAQLGVMLMLAGIPRAALMLVGGALSDRVSPRKIMLWSNLLRGGLVVGLMALTFSNRVQLWHFYLFAFVFGAFDAFFYPAYSSILPRLVPLEDLEAGNALLQVTQRISLLVGPALAGVVVTLAGTSLALAIDALTFLVAAVTLFLMAEVPVRTEQPAGSEPREGIFAAIRAGLSYVLHDPLLPLVMLLVALVDFAFVGPISVGLPVLANRVFQDATAYGAMISGFGAGSLAGVLLAGALRIKRIGRLMLGLLVLFAAALGPLGIMPGLIPVIVLLALAGVGSGIFNVKGVSWIQRQTDTAMIARVMSLLALSSVGLQPISNAIAGTLVDVSLPWMFGAAGLLILLGALGLTASRLRSAT